MDEKMDISRHIFLIGFMGTGKSAVSKKLSDLMGLKTIDMDDFIEKETSMNIKDIFAEKGEEYFRGLETETLKKLAELPVCVVSCGGGTVLRESNREIMRASGMAVLLTASAITVYDRVKNNQQRPLLKEHMTAEQISVLMNERQSCYEAAADIIIDTDDKTIEEICSEVIKRIASAKNTNEENI